MRFPSLRTTAAPLLLAIATAAAACVDSTEPINRTASFTGQWAGQPWAGDAYATIVMRGAGTDTLYVTGVSPVNAGPMPAEVISLRVPFHGAGSYALDASAVDVRELLGGDVITASYAGSGTPAGTLEITSYGGPGGTIEGRVSFVVRSSGEFASRGTGPIQFEDGHFRAQVRRWPEE